MKCETKTIEFSLNVFTEFSDKNNIIFKKIAGLEPTISCVRDRDCANHCATETQLTEKTVKLILIHASLNWLRFSEFTECSEFSFHLGKTPLEFFTISPQYKNANVANFVFALPLKNQLVE